MKAYVLRELSGIGSLRLEDWADLPSPNPTEALIRVKAVSLNFRDLMTVEGKYNPNQPLPLVPCSDAVGEIVEIGSEVSRMQVGMRVLPIFCQGWVSGEPTREKLRSTLGGPLQGSLREFMLIDQQGLVRVPEHLSDTEAATLPCAAVTAWNAVMVQGGVSSRDTVLIQGGGGVSLFALQFAKTAGAAVIWISHSEERLERLKALGCDQVLLRTPGWGEQVRDLTAGNGVDVVVEVGGGDSINESLRAIGIGGTLVLIGVASGGVSRIRLASILMRHVRLQGIVVGSRNMFEGMNRRIGQDLLRPVIDRVFDFAGAVDAFRYFAEATHFGKVCIRCG